MLLYCMLVVIYCCSVHLCEIGFIVSICVWIPIFYYFLYLTFTLRIHTGKQLHISLWHINMFLSNNFLWSISEQLFWNNYIGLTWINSVQIHTELKTIAVPLWRCRWPSPCNVGKLRSLLLHSASSKEEEPIHASVMCRIP